MLNVSFQIRTPCLYCKFKVWSDETFVQYYEAFLVNIFELSMNHTHNSVGFHGCFITLPVIFQRWRRRYYSSIFFLHLLPEYSSMCCPVGYCTLSYVGDLNGCEAYAFCALQILLPYLLNYLLTNECSDYTVCNYSNCNSAELRSVSTT